MRFLFRRIYREGDQTLDAGTKGSSLGMGKLNVFQNQKGFGKMEETRMCPKIRKGSDFTVSSPGKCPCLLAIATRFTERSSDFSLYSTEVAN